jgi:hypothetical protein
MQCPAHGRWAASRRSPSRVWSRIFSQPGDDRAISKVVMSSYQVGGFAMIVPRQSVQPLAMRLEDAMRFILTAGAKAGDTKPPLESSPSG